MNLDTPKYSSRYNFTTADLGKLIHHRGEHLAFPPYDIISLDEDQYRIDLAIAGYRKEDITIEVEGSNLSVFGRKEPSSEHFIYNGIAHRDWRRSWELKKDLEVTKAKVENGILQIYLKRNEEAVNKIKIE